jgi:hypothetical protein
MPSTFQAGRADLPLTPIANDARNLGDAHLETLRIEIDGTTTRQLVDRDRKLSNRILGG